mgnify:CR=1 FL=1
MTKIAYTPDARVLVGISGPAAYACRRERGHLQAPS